MNWRNWKNHPFIFTLVGALLLGYLVRKFTEPTPYRHTYEASRPVAISPAPKSAPSPAPVVMTPAPAVTKPAPAASTPSPYQVAQLPPDPAPAGMITLPTPVERPVISTPTYGSGRRGYTTYTFTIGETAYPLDGQIAFDHLCGMKRQCESLDSQMKLTGGMIDADRANLANLKQHLSIARLTLDRTSQAAIDAYNAQVETEGQLIDALNQKVDEHNALNDRRQAIFQSMHDYAQQHRR